MFVRLHAYNDKKCAVELWRAFQWDGLSQRSLEKLNVLVRIQVWLTLIILNGLAMNQLTRDSFSTFTGIIKAQ